MMGATIAGISSALPRVISGLIDKIIPDKAAADAAKLKLLELEQAGELEESKIRMSAILAEASSSDKWTSRARPSFMYVMYIFILFAIPMGVISVISPETSKLIATGSSQWLSSIPTNLYELFGFVCIGYAGADTYQKHSYNKHVLSATKK